MSGPWETFKIHSGVRQSCGQFDSEDQAFGEALKHRGKHCRVEIEGPWGVFYSDEDIGRAAQGLTSARDGSERFGSEKFDEGARDDLSRFGSGGKFGS
jgi:hypothetical protein